MSWRSRSSVPLCVIHGEIFSLEYCKLNIIRVLLSIVDYSMRGGYLWSDNYICMASSMPVPWVSSMDLSLAGVAMLPLLV